MPLNNVAKTLLQKLLHQSNRFIRNAAYIYAAFLIQGILGLLFWVVAVRLVSPEVIGYNTAAINIAMLASIIGLAGISSTIVKMIPNVEDKRSLLGSALLIVAIFSLVTSVCTVLVLKSWALPQITFATMVLICVGTVISTIIGTLDGAFTASLQPKYSTIKGIIFAICKVLLLVLLFIPVVYSVTLTWFISVIIALGALVYYLRKLNLGNLRVSRFGIGILIKEWRFTLSNYIIHSLHHGVAAILPVMVTAMVGEINGAYFYIPWMIAWNIFAIPDSLAMSLFAEGSNDKELFKKQMGRAVKILMLISIAAIIGFSALGKYFLYLFGTEYGMKSYLLLVILIASSPLFAIIVLFKAYARVYNKNLQLTLVWSLLIIGTMLGSYLFIPNIGINAVGWSWITSCVVAVVYIVISSKLSLKDNKYVMGTLL